MSKHLNADQMAEWMAGERRPELELHLRECAGCRLALEEMQTALGGWRDAVQGWSDREYQVAQHRAATDQSAGRLNTVWHWVYLRLHWAGGATAVCALAAMLAWHYGVKAPAAQRSVPSSGLVSTANTNTGHGMNPDAVLMRQVDREVSQTVPDAMTPLMELVSWDDAQAIGEEGAGAAGKDSSRQAE